MQEKDYFDFLQVAIGAKDAWDMPLSDQDWQGLYAFCKRQALLGIGFTGVERLHLSGFTCPLVLKMKWSGITMKIEQRNMLLIKQCKEVTEDYRHDGLDICILKGQGNLFNYPEELRYRRQSGDIDAWLRVPLENDGLAIAKQTDNKVEYVKHYGKKAIIEFVKQQHRQAGNTVRPKVIYYHLDAAKIGDTEVEAHFRVGYMNAPLRNWRMQRWFRLHEDECMKNMTQMGFSVLTVSVNIIYQMTHIFSHYMDEGLGLRQLLDYYYALKVWHNDSKEKKDIHSMGMSTAGLDVSVMSREEIYCTMKRLGMGKFCAAVMWVLHEVFALPSHYYICPPNEKEGRKLLREIMLAGNFGQHDMRGRKMKTGGMIKHAIWKLNRIMRLVGSYPEEALSEPFFRVYHYFWRMYHR